MAILLTKLASFEEKREKPRRAMRILSSNGLFESFSSYINSTTDYSNLPTSITYQVQKHLRVAANLMIISLELK